MRHLDEGHAFKPIALHGLGNLYLSRFERLGDAGDINRAIECHAQAGVLLPEAHTELPARLNMLGQSYVSRFEHLGELMDLEEAIECQTMANNLTPEGHMNKSGRLTTLGGSHERRFQRTGASEDIRKAARMYKQAANNPTGFPATRFVAAKSWARLYSRLGETSSLQAYSLAMALIPKVVWLGATINRRYRNVVLMGTTASGAAAAAISAQEYALALEWLEEGRSIIWS